MFIFIFLCVVLLACYGKRVSDVNAQNTDGSYKVSETEKKEILVKDVFKADPVTGDLQPASICYECESYLCCLGYVSQKLYKTNKRPCDTAPLESLPYMGLQVIKDMCADCDYPRDCTNCPLKGRSGFVMDCQSCDAAEICEGIEIAEDPNSPERICGMLSEAETVANPDDMDIPF